MGGTTLEMLLITFRMKMQKAKNLRKPMGNYKG